MAGSLPFRFVTQDPSPETAADARLEETGMLRRTIGAGAHWLLLEPGVLSEAADWMVASAPVRCRRRVSEGGQAAMKTPPIVSSQEWDRARDALAAKRRRMPWMAVEKEYRFDGPDGPVSLLGLFEGRRQLIVYRAFYAPDVTTYPPGGGAYPERACVGCSFLADQVAHPAHLNARDTTLAFVSRAPQAEIQGLKERMGWELFPW